MDVPRLEKQSQVFALSEEICAVFILEVFRKLKLRRQREFVSDGEGGGMKVRTSLDKVRDEISLMKCILHPNLR